MTASRRLPRYVQHAVQFRQYVSVSLRAASASTAAGGGWCDCPWDKTKHTRSLAAI